ncbi:HEAT repeat domain-containing protein [Dactylosporangium sp. NPDC049525]|uniref:HEAT repeat domain-containing protein n=1 Tax=Dactylosporangium sp. NPDC049525 TaxID=3154730 RepID=UPI003439F8C8
MFDTHAALSEVLAGVDDLTVDLDPGVAARLAASGDRTLVPRVQAAMERFLDEGNFYGVEVLADVLAGILGTRAFPLLLRASARPLGHDWDSLIGLLGQLMDADPAGCRPTARLFATERHPDLRLAGLWALGYVVTADDLDLLGAALRDADPHVRQIALGSVGSLRGDARVLPAVLEALRDPDPAVRGTAVLTVGDVGDLGALDSLLALRRDPSPRVRSLLGHATGQLIAPGWGPPRTPPGPAQVETAVAALVDLLADPDREVRVGAVQGLGMIGGPSAVGALIALADDPDAAIRAAVAFALGTLAAPDTVATLRVLARDEAAQVRSELVTALGRPGRPEAVPLVVALAADPDPDVRVRAAAAIGRLDDTAALDTVRRLAADDPEPRVRRTAAAVLARQAASAPA